MRLKFESLQKSFHNILITLRNFFYTTRHKQMQLKPCVEDQASYFILNGWLSVTKV